MNFTIDQLYLVESLKAVSKLVPRKKTKMPILRNALVTVYRDRVVFTSTDMDKIAHNVTLCTGSEEFSFLLPLLWEYNGETPSGKSATKYSTFLQYAQLLEYPVTFTLDGERIVIRCGKSELALPSADVAGFPAGAASAAIQEAGESHATQTETYAGTVITQKNAHECFEIVERERAEIAAEAKVSAVDFDMPSSAWREPKVSAREIEWREIEAAQDSAALTVDFDAAFEWDKLTQGATDMQWESETDEPTRDTEHECPLTQWANEYVAQLIDRCPEIAGKLERSLDWQLGLIGTVPDAQWRNGAKLAFDAKLRKVGAL